MYICDKHGIHGKTSCPKCNVEAMDVENRHRDKSRRRILEKTITLPKGMVLTEASRHGGLTLYEYIIDIPGLHTATLVINDDALDALRDMEPQVSIS